MTPGKTLCAGSALAPARREELPTLTSHRAGGLPPRRGGHCSLRWERQRRKMPPPTPTPTQGSGTPRMVSEYRWPSSELGREGSLGEKPEVGWGFRG